MPCKRKIVVKSIRQFDPEFAEELRKKFEEVVSKIDISKIEVPEPDKKALEAEKRVEFTEHMDMGESLE